MRLYKFVPTKEIAQQVSVGVFRFYELTKYKRLEETTGRSDLTEGSVSFTNDECKNFPDAIPIASFKGVEFKCVSFSPDDEYLRQYFVFCMSMENNERVIGDCTYAVELDDDIFATFETLLPTVKTPETDARGVKFFSHGSVEYYGIHSHPASIEGKEWRAAYLKHSDFARQHEYRAALFASDQFFERVGKAPMVIERQIYDNAKRAPRCFKWVA